MPLFDMDPNTANNLVNFGGAMMQAGGQPGASFAGAAGAGVQGMQAGALQRAQTQNIQGEAQSRQLQNSLIPYQLQFMKYRMAALQNDMNDDSGTPSSGNAGMPYSSTPGAPKAAEAPTTAKPTNAPAIAPAVFRTAQQTGLPPALLHGVYMTESSGNPDAPNGDGGKAVGGMQLHAGAAADAGVTNRSDPQQNLKGGATYLKQLTDRYGDPQLGILAYNWGPGNVDNWIANGKDPAQIPQPQQGYLKKVNSYMQVVNPQSSAGSPQRNIGQGVTQPSATPAQNNLPQTDANIQTLQGRITQMSKKLRVAETIGMPTKDLEINLKAAQEQLAAAMKTQQEVESAGPKAENEKSAGNLTDAQKTYNVAVGNLPRALQRFDELRKASASASGGGWGIDENGEGLLPDLARSSIGGVIEPKTATANQIIQQASKQGILAELGPQLAGLRGNKFLESIASGASGLNAADPAPTKINAINGLQDQYIANLKSLAAQRRSYGDKNVPSDKEIDEMVKQYSGTDTKPHPLDGTVAKNAKGESMILRNGQWMPQ